MVLCPVYGLLKERKLSLVVRLAFGDFECPITDRDADVIKSVITINKK
jgi:hypothetical protein